MLAILPESAALTRRTPGGVAWSVILHFGIAGLVTVASGWSEEIESPAPTTRADTIVFIPVTRTDGARRADHHRAPRPGEPEGIVRSPMLPAPITVPITIPPVNPEALPIVTGGEPEVIVGRLGPGDRSPGTMSGGSGSDAGDPWRAQPDRLAVALPGQPRPRYPERLRAARVEGRVVAQFVIDTTGVVDLASARIVESDHEDFTAAVIAVLPYLRFHPAEANGHRVRQLASQSFVFSLARP